MPLPTPQRRAPQSDTTTKKKLQGCWRALVDAPYWAYLSASAGPRLEIVSRQLQPMMEHYFATGSVPS